MEEEEDAAIAQDYALVRRGQQLDERPVLVQANQK